jgi:hypothetical protein
MCACLMVPGSLVQSSVWIGGELLSTRPAGCAWVPWHVSPWTHPSPRNKGRRSICQQRKYTHHRAMKEIARDPARARVPKPKGSTTGTRRPPAAAAHGPHGDGRRGQCSRHYVRACVRLPYPRPCWSCRPGALVRAWFGRGEADGTDPKYRPIAAVRDAYVH